MSDSSYDVNHDHGTMLMVAISRGECKVVQYYQCHLDVIQQS